MSETKTESTRMGKAKQFSLFAVSLVIIVSTVAVVFGQQISQDDPVAHPPLSLTTGTLVPVRTSFVDPQTGERSVRIIYYPQTSLSPHEAKSRGLVSRIHQLRDDSNKEERETLLAELEQSLSAEFAERHEQQTKEIEALKKRLDSARAMLDQRAELKDKIIARRLNELLGEPDALDWNPATTPTTQPTVLGNQQPRPIYHRAVPSTSSQFDPPDFRQDPPASAPAGIPAYSDSQQTWPLKYRTGPITDAIPATAPSTTYKPDDRTPNMIRMDALRGDVFGIARRLITARLAAKAAKEESERLSVLAKKGAVTPYELKTVLAKSNQASAEAALAQAEMDAFEERLKRESEFALSSLKRYQSLQSQAEARYQAGTAMMDSVLQAEAAVAATKRALADIEDSKRQLAKALELIEGNEVAGEDDDGTVDEQKASAHENEPPRSPAGPPRS